MIAKETGLFPRLVSPIANVLMATVFAALLSNQVCAVTIYIRLPHSSFVPICASLGFEFHHARPQFVFMLKWLPVHRPSKFPGFANTLVGVGGLVVNENEEVLVVQERYLNTPHWKVSDDTS